MPSSKVTRSQRRRCVSERDLVLDPCDESALVHPSACYGNIRGAVVDQQIVAELDQPLGEDDAHTIYEVRHVHVRNRLLLDLVRRFGREGGRSGNVDDFFRICGFEHAPAHGIYVALFDRRRAVEGGQPPDVGCDWWCARAEPRAPPSGSPRAEERDALRGPQVFERGDLYQLDSRHWPVEDDVRTADLLRENHAVLVFPCNARAETLITLRLE